MENVKILPVANSGKVNLQVRKQSLRKQPAGEQPLSDEKLFSLCKMFGARALEARRKFLGLLPEINRREQAERLKGKSWLARRGFPDIFVFAKKLAGASEKQVRIVLNLKIRFEDKPALQSMLINGEVSANKLARVVSIATVENQEALAEQVRVLPTRAIEVLVRDVKNEQNILQGSDGDASKNTVRDGLQEPLIKDAHLRVQTSGIGNAVRSGEKNAAAAGELLSMKMSLKLDNDVVAELHELQQKGININEILREALWKRRDGIAREKEELEAREMAGAGKTHGVRPAEAREIPQSDPANNIDGGRPTTGRTFSRYISVRVKKILADEHGTKCSIQNCRRDSEQIHHTRRFALTQSHDPRYLAPLCREHHLIAHSIDRRFWRRRGT
jgi:hypothetical protein